jgi:hypothetical protein
MVAVQNSKRGDNSTYTFTKKGGGMYILSATPTKTATVFLHAHLQVVYYNCVKFHKTPKSRLGRVVLTRYTTPLFVNV